MRRIMINPFLDDDERRQDGKVILGGAGVFLGVGSNVYFFEDRRNNQNNPLDSKL